MAKKKHQRRKYGETIEGISSGKQQQKATDMIQDHLERKDVFCYTVTFGPNAFTSASCKQRNWLSTWCPSKFSKTKLQWKSYWCHSSLRSLLIESTVPFFGCLVKPSANPSFSPGKHGRHIRKSCSTICRRSSVDKVVQRTKETSHNFSHSAESVPGKMRHFEPFLGQTEGYNPNVVLLLLDCIVGMKIKRERVHE